MKQPALIFVLLVQSFASLAQKASNETFYLFDSDMKGVTKIESAAFMICVSKLSDTLWQFDTYLAFGPLASSEQFRDEDAQIPSGHFTFYHPTGYVDSTGTVVRGRLNGDWSYYNASGKAVKQKKYDMGRLIKTRDLLQEEKAHKDSIEAGLLEAESDDFSEFNKSERESHYDGGNQAWARYLNKNFRYPERAINNNISGQVVVQFSIDTVGKTDDVTIFKSVEFSIDKEAKRLILTSNKWKPAWQDGRLVKSYKRQPIIFQLSER